MSIGYEEKARDGDQKPVVDNPSPESSSWDFIQPHEAEPLPSLTTAPSVETAEHNKDEASETEEQRRKLTTSTLLAFNENNTRKGGAKASMEATKGTATRASNDSDEPMGPYAPADGDSDPCIYAVGSWAEEAPRNSRDLGEELFAFKGE